MKVQQTLLEIDESNIEGKQITEADVQLLDLPQSLLDRNRRLIAISERVLKGKELL